MQTVNQSGRPKDLEKRARILQAAKAIFLKSGYHGTSMNQIAQEADHDRTRDIFTGEHVPGDDRIR